MIFPDNTSVMGISVAENQIYFTSLYKQNICLHFNFVTKASLQFVIIAGLLFWL